MLRLSLFFFVISVAVSHAEDFSFQVITKDNDNTAVQLKFPERAITLNAQELEKLIGNLAELRAAMKPAIPDNIVGSAAAVSIDPPWLVQDGPEPLKATLFIRDPKFGWRGFGFPKSEAKTLGTQLLARSMN